MKSQQLASVEDYCRLTTNRIEKKCFGNLIVYDYPTTGTKHVCGSYTSENAKRHRKIKSFFFGPFWGRQGTRRPPPINNCTRKGAQGTLSPYRAMSLRIKLRFSADIGSWYLLTYPGKVGRATGNPVEKAWMPRRMRVPHGLFHAGHPWVAPWISVGHSMVFTIGYPTLNWIFESDCGGSQRGRSRPVGVSMRMIINEVTAFGPQPWSFRVSLARRIRPENKAFRHFSRLEHSV